MKRFLTRLIWVVSSLVSLCVSAQHHHPEPKLNVGIVLYPGFEVLDVYGPAEMWGYIPDFKLHMIAETVGPVKSAQGTSSYADYDFETAPKLDIVLVPGGIGTQAQLDNAAMLNYLKTVHQQTQYTTSVCTGSALLAKIGALDNLQATTNKRFFFLSEMQSSKVDWVESARWVQSGKVFTSSGVSAGTDMALGLIEKMYGGRWASGIASSLEYTWQSNAGEDPFSQFTNRLLEGQNGLISAMPSVNSKPDTPPKWLWLFFDSAPDVSTSTISLSRIGKERTAIELQGLHTMGNNDLMIGVNPELTPGEYEVRWSSMLANDDEERTGTYRFKVTE